MKRTSSPVCGRKVLTFKPGIFHTWKRKTDIFLVLKKPKQQSHAELLLVESPVGPTMGLNDLAKPMPSCAGVGIAPQAKSQGGGFRVVTTSSLISLGKSAF